MLLSLETKRIQENELEKIEKYQKREIQRLWSLKNKQKIIINSPSEIVVTSIFSDIIDKALSKFFKED